jgi:asparagine synthase (glutamine-hydrolysing)
MLNAARRSLLPFVGALPVRGRARKLRRFLSMGALDRFVLFNACEVLPSDLHRLGMSATGEFPFRERVLAEAQTVYPGDPLRQAMYSDQHTFLCSILDRNDRMTMGVSIECRVPFLDYRLVEGLAAMPSEHVRAGLKTKPILRRSLGHRLPDSVMQHRKIGFGVPWRRYLRSAAFSDLVRSLPDVEPIASGPFDRRKVRGVIEEFLSGQDAHEGLVRALAMVTIWYQAVCGSDARNRAASPSDSAAVQAASF